ncbi:uncharacterized protein LOC133806034 [Humulus lupulus]|uniref:uncharacterized protein LOC133806034 n=1 Tax=Humulus lupulus TaxID=3486 RepID=UPI002B40D861|nr:uncharacterized protein LOC133806034 [Humulus lupulus]
MCIEEKDVKNLVTVDNLQMVGLIPYPEMFKHCIAPPAPKRKSGEGSGSTPLSKMLMTICHAQHRSVDYKELIKVSSSSPATLIVINDIAAYFFGFFFGRTPLIKLSPKKTWEGFIDASVTTVISAFLNRTTKLVIMLDKNWLRFNRASDEYREGAKNFVEMSEKLAGYPEKLLCPCKVCRNLSHQCINILYEHLVIYGIDPTYKIWFHHGEELSRDDDVETMETFDSYNLFRATNIDGCDFESHLEGHDEIFMEKIEDADTPLYPQCTKYTKLSSIVALYKVKTTNGWSDKSFDELLRLLNDMFPLDNMIPKSMYEVRKFLRLFDLGYENIHACVNDCCLFRKDKENLQECPTCGTSRWMSDKLTKKVRHGVPAKVLRYFPIIPRLKRMFMSSRISKELRWHHNNKSCDGKMRHPVDLAAWELVNDKWPSFSNEERNIRLGLSTDGFNPFRPKQPVNVIDIYLEPLVEDLKLLWNEGVDAHDALDNTNFKLRAILMWTIQDFPAYGNLAGCKNKGCFSCPLCGYGTHSEWLKHSGKFSYRGHRKFLKEDHPFRSKRSWFDGEVEHGNPPRIMNGTTIAEHLKDFVNELYVHHNLDVMHIEKNVCESICNTLLDVAGKSKDGLKTRLDLQHMGIRSALHPQEKGTRTYLPAALHTLSKLEKELFCKRLFSLKVPDGYSSNIRNCVSMEQCKLMGLKSHDCHILMQQLLPVAIKGLMPLGPRDAIIRLCTFFNRICQLVLDRESIMTLEMMLLKLYAY